MSAPHHTPPLAVIVAGGGSRRFGRPKSHAPLGGERLVDRVVAALRGAGLAPVLVTGHADLFADLGLPTRADRAPGLGPLGGIHSALLWAREEGRAGALCVACDQPFLSAPLLAHLLDVARRTGAPAVVPESGSRLGFEPLCAWYSVGAVAEIEARLARGDVSLGGLVAALDAERLPLATVRRYGDPRFLFLNVNTPADHEAALRHLDAAPR